MRNVQAASKGSIGNWLITMLLFTAATGGCANDKADKDNLTAGYAELDNRHFDEAIQRADQQLQKTHEGEGSAEALYLKGRAYEQRVKAGRGEAGTDMATAADCYQRALRLSPVKKLEGDIRTSLGNVQYWRDDYAGALKEWTAAYDLLESPEIKSFVLYRAGLCQQRLGQFDAADHTFAAVIQRFPGTDAATRAHEHQGYKNFTVRLATFSTSTAADAAVAALRKQGAAAQRAVDSKQRGIVTVGPAKTYGEAQGIKARFAGQYPDAMILP